MSDRFFYGHGQRVTPRGPRVGRAPARRETDAYGMDEAEREYDEMLGEQRAADLELERIQGHWPAACLTTPTTRRERPK